MGDFFASIFSSLDWLVIANDAFGKALGGVILVAVLAFFSTFKRLKRRISNSMSTLREFVWQGGICFYSDRASQSKSLGTLTNYLCQTNRTFRYFGLQFYTLDQSTARGDIERMIQREVVVECYLLDPGQREIAMAVANFLSVEPELFISQLQNNLAGLLKLKRSLGKAGDNLRIFVHDLPLYNTCFLIDVEDTALGRILIDHKLVGSARSESYGFELNLPNKSPMFDRVKLAYLGITKKSKIWE